MKKGVSKLNDDPFAVGAEVPGMDNLSAITAINKQEEEVQRFIEQGHLGASSRAIYVLENGSIVQKTAVLQHLTLTFAECNDTEITAVVKELNDMWKQSHEVQLTASPAVIAILSKVRPKHVAELQDGVNTMIEISNENIRREWCNVLVECVPFLPQTELESTLSLVLRKCDTSEAQVHRTMGCRVLGKLAQRFDSMRIEKSFLKRSMALCQDTDVAVRVTMCNQLNVIARAIGLGLAKQYVTQELLELLVDEEKVVSRAAFTALIDLVDFFDATYRRDQVYPILKHYISSPPEDVLSLLIEEFGRFLYKIRGDVTTQDDIALFGGFFVSSSQKSDADVRRLCAFNFPAVVASLPATFYLQSLHHTLKALSQDPNVPTRVAIASGLHELCGLLNEKGISSLQECFLLLINDAHVHVQEKAFGHLDVLLSFFHTHLTKDDERDAFMNGVLTPLVNFEVAVRLRWRNFSVLFGHFEHFPKYFKPQQLFDRLVPILFRHIMSGVEAVKPRCAYLLIHFTRHFPTPLIVDMFRRIVADLGKSPTHSHRVQFLEVSSHAFLHLSRKFTRDRLLETIWELSKDSVSNVRLRCAALMVDVKRILRPPVESEHLSTMQATATRLSLDSDHEVKQTMLAVMPLIEEMDKKHIKYAAALAKPGKSSGVPDEEDATDRRREEAEGNLLEAAKEADKMERRQKLRDLLKSERDAEGAAAGPVLPGASGGGAKRPSDGKPGGGKAVPSGPAPAAAAKNTPLGTVGKSQIIPPVGALAKTASMPTLKGVTATVVKSLGAGKK